MDCMLKNDIVSAFRVPEFDNSITVLAERLRSQKITWWRIWQDKIMIGATHSQMMQKKYKYTDTHMCMPVYMCVHAHTHILRKWERE